MRGRRQRDSNPLSLFSLQDIITCLTGIMILIVLVLALEALRTPKEAPPPGIDIEVPDPAFMEAEIRRLTEERLEWIQQISARQPMDPALSTLERAKRLEQLRTESEAFRRQIEQQEQKQQAERDRRLQVRHRLRELERQLEAVEAENETWRAREETASNWVSFIPGRELNKTPHLIVCDGRRVQVISLGTPKKDRQWALDETQVGFAQLMAQSSSTRDYFVVILKPSGVDVGLGLYETLRKRGFQAGYDVLEEDQDVLVPEGGP